MATTPMSDSSDAVAKLILTGALVPVSVFGPGLVCPSCAKGLDDEPCPHCGSEVVGSFGLCDRFTHVGSVGSDCNRAEWFLLRPTDELMDSEGVRQALRDVLDDDDPKEPQRWQLP